ncbi:MAG: tetratricopeptide repeat protein [Actinomycetota bacterium]
MGWRNPNAITISLSPLSDDETTTLIRELLERSLLMGDAQTELLARAGGNPLYAEEYVRVLRERGHLEQLPETVQGMIAARLDLLDPAEKALIQDAAVIGKSFWLGALTTQDGQDRADIERRLHALERKEFVRRERASSVAGDVEYSFRHVLFRDVAYGQIPRAERAEKHRRAAEWMENLGRPEDHSEMLAYHYMEALELCSAAGLDPAAFSGRAASALADAGERALRLNAFAAAARYDRAAIAQLPAGNPRRASLLLHLGTANFFLGEPDPTVLESARDEFLAIGKIEEAAFAETRLADGLWLNGERDAAFAHLDRARQLLEDQPPSPIKARTIVAASRLMALAAQHEPAIRFGEQALRMAEELDLVDVKAAALNNIGIAKALGRGQDEGFEELADAIRVAEDANAPYELVRAKNNLASTLWSAGRFTEFIDLRQQALDDAKRFGQVNFIRWIMAGGVLTSYLIGDWEAALRDADDFLAGVEAGRAHYLAAQVYCDRARIRLGRDDLAGALADVEPGLELGRKAADPQAFLPTLSTAAHVVLDAGDPERASTMVSEFLAFLGGPMAPGFGMARAHELAWTATALGRGREIVDALPGNGNPWVLAAVAYASGDPAAAADICGEMGVPSEEMYDRLQAGKQLIETGRIDAGREQLRRALDFYRSVDATRYIKECEALLAAA